MNTQDHLDVLKTLEATLARMEGNVTGEILAALHAAVAHLLNQQQTPAEQPAAEENQA